MLFAVEVADLPVLNASLNACATALLITGWVLIRRRRETAHRNVMLAAFGVSVLFLISYLTYHAQAQPKSFTTDAAPLWRSAYYALLLTHVVLAAAVPFLAGITIWLGLTDRRAAHRRLAKWTFPIWLYVSITGVVIYFLLYQVFPVPAA